MGFEGNLPDEATPTHLLHEIPSPERKRNHPIDHGQKKHEAYGDLAADTKTFAEKKRQNLTDGYDFP